MENHFNHSGEHMLEQPTAAPVEPTERVRPVTPAEGMAEPPVFAPPAPDVLTQNPQPSQPLPRFEPQPVQSRGWSYPYAPQAQAQPAVTPKPKSSKKGGKTALRVIAVILLFCISVGGGFIGANLKGWLQGDSGGSGIVTPNQMGSSGGSADTLVGKREDTTVNIHEVDTDKEMTAAQVYALNVNATVGITTSITTNYWGYQTTSAASGSGFIYSKDGYIVTNYHVVADSDSVTVALYDGRALDAKIIGFDESNDVAVLKVEASDLTPVIIGNSTNLNVGDPVVAIGNPLGELTFSLTAGAVSALGRQITFSDGIVMSLIQTDCAINSGNSGGALFNLYGEVIGITNAKYSGTSGGGATIDNIGFAIPINHAREIVESIIKTGYVAKPYIGVSVADVTQENQSYGLPQGASVRKIETGSPAEIAGLQMYDIVTEINGEKITGASDLKMLVTQSAPGDILKLKLWRKGQMMELEITVAERSESIANPK